MIPAARQPVCPRRRAPCFTVPALREDLIIATILVVDDDDYVREMLELALDGQGHDVDSVGSGHAALEQLTHHVYDLVVCDLSMPGVDGRAIHRAIDLQPPPRPAVVFITGYADAGPYEESLTTAQVPVLRKPFDIELLRETVRRVLRGT